MGEIEIIRLIRKVKEYTIRDVDEETVNKKDCVHPADKRIKYNSGMFTYVVCGECGKTIKVLNYDNHK